MPMPCLTTDLTAVFSDDAFGETAGSVRWRGVVIKGAIFDDEDIDVALGEGVGEIQHQAVLSGPSAQFPGIADGDPVIVRGRSFRVKNWKDDGTGVIDIWLEEVGA
jgi:hypothetical protein